MKMSKGSGELLAIGGWCQDWQKSKKMFGTRFSKMKMSKIATEVNGGVPWKIWNKGNPTSSETVHIFPFLPPPFLLVHSFFLSSFCVISRARPAVKPITTESQIDVIVGLYPLMGFSFEISLKVLPGWLEKMKDFMLKGICNLQFATAAATQKELQ